MALVCLEGTAYNASARSVVLRSIDDEGRSLGIALQDEVSNQLKLLASRAPVVSVESKGATKIASGKLQEDERK